MKVTREQAAENRARIVQVASELFREKGFDGIGVADLMSAAGLTHGGFYGHFKSKDDLAAEACGLAAKSSAERWAALIEKSNDPLAAIVNQYLSEKHRDTPGQGCPFAALGADAARETGAVRRAFTTGLTALTDILMAVLPRRSKAVQRQQALAMMAQMVGAMVLARAVDDAKLSRDILRAAVAQLSTQGA